MVVRLSPGTRVCTGSRRRGAEFPAVHCLDGLICPGQRMSRVDQGIDPFRVTGAGIQRQVVDEANRSVPA